MESLSSLIFQLQAPTATDPLCDTLPAYIRSRAYEVLKERTGQDFGYDADAWEKWAKESGRLTAEIPKW